jgi:hypothetical protein
MQVPSRTSYAALIQPRPQTTSSFSASGTSAASATASSTASANSVGTYDFTNMTPNQMKSAAQALYGSGKIDSKQAIRMQLMGMPLGTMVNGQFEPLTAAQRESFANTPVNYMQLFQGNMAFLQQNGMASDPKSGYDDDQTILTAMQSAQGQTSSVNITA